MPPLGSPRPFRLQALGEPLTVADAVYQSIGAASVCWEHIDQAGTFDPDQAREVGETLLAFLREQTAATFAAARSAYRAGDVVALERALGLRHPDAPEFVEALGEWDMTPQPPPPGGIRLPGPPSEDYDSEAGHVQP